MAEILIVDDEEQFRTELVELFRSKGHEVSEAASGTEAVEMVERSNFDAMILDIIMPGLHGIDVLAKVSKTSPEMPVIVSATKKDKLLVKRALDAGARGNFVKPFEKEQVLDVFNSTLSEYLKEREQKRTLEQIEHIDQTACKFEEAAATSGGPIWQNKTVLQKSVDAIARYLSVEKVSLTQVDQARGMMQLTVASGYEITDDKIDERKIGEGPAGFVATEGKPLLVKNISEDDRFSDTQRGEARYKNSSFICAPIKIEGEVVGVVSANDKVSKKPFDENDLFLLTIFANQMASVIEKSKLAQQLEVENLRMALASKLNEILITEVEPQPVFEKTTVLARETVKCSAAYLMIQWDQESDFIFVAGADALGKLDAKFTAVSGKGLTGMVLQTGETISVPGAADDEMFSPEVDGQILERPTSFVASPLKLKGQVLGVIVCLNKMGEECFGPADEKALETIAQSTSVALKTAWLHHNLIQTIDQVADVEKENEALKQKLSKAYLLIEALKKKVK